MRPACGWCYHRATLHTTDLGCMSCDCPRYHQAVDSHRAVVLVGWLLVAIGLGVGSFVLLALIGWATGW